MARLPTIKMQELDKYVGLAIIGDEFLTWDNGGHPCIFYSRGEKGGEIKKLQVGDVVRLPYGQENMLFAGGLGLIPARRYAKRYKITA